MNSKALVSTSNLSKYYFSGSNTIKAVHDANLDISSGQFVSIVGSSGSGKSTLLNLLSGLDSPTKGEINYDGKILNRLSQQELSRFRAEKVGIIFQSFNLLSHQTALKNVELALLFNNTPKNKRTEKAIEILEQLGMGERINHLPLELSGGEQQRVAIARALVKKPEILFADEPTGNLDMENSKAIATIMKQLNNGGLTILMATHDLSMATMLSDNIIKMDYGNIIENKFNITKESDNEIQ